ncbi:hypothetical protein C8Q73DRAFT_789576 [Cubamyces lactineus]|nr:hypothetical protein C8Q73DRAFT_789576 [Cubamyces lactineus]
MPRLGSESNSPVRRHSPNQTLSNYFQVNYQVWQIRSSGPSRTEPEPRADPGPSTPPPQPSSDPQLDALDGLLNRTRASASRTRWNARSSGSPYGHRPLHKWLPSEQKHFEELSAFVEMFPEPGSGDEHDEEKALQEQLMENSREDEGEMADEEDHMGEESDWEEADIAEPPPTRLHTQARLSSSSIAVRKRERNKKKRAKARAKAKEKMKPPAPPDPVRDAPKDLLMSMSRIAQLVGSLNADPPDERNELIKRFQEAFGEASDSQLGSLPAEPTQWRAEVLQSVRRMESMLGQMEKWQAQVAPGEIEALREETARLEVRVRAVVEHKERERKVLQTAVRTAVEAKLGNIPGITFGGVSDDSSKASEEVQVHVAETAEASKGDESVVTDEGSLILSGANGEEDDAASISDSLSEGPSCPSLADAGPTELQSDQRSVLDKTIPANPPSAKPPPHTTAHTTDINASIPPIIPVSAPNDPPRQSIFKFGSASATPLSISSSPLSVKPSAPTPSTAPRPATVSLPTVNLNVPPAAPANPIEHLKKKPWSMVEVLFLLEVVAHFPPAEHGWTFIAEAYNNILITRPLQEWFGKQAATSNDEEAKMKSVLQKMHTEARQLRTRAAKAKADAASAEHSKVGQRGKPAPFGSTDARAEADARGKHPANAVFDEDTLFHTRLPHPFPPPAGRPASAADNPALPPPAQRIVTFPRRRPPFSLPSEDARAFARVMASAAAGVRPPSGESRAAMLALYSATKSRYPVRTAWDCWHRWCTPWIVQDADDASRATASNAEPESPPTVLDYIAGNLCLPAGTWLSQPRGFVYRPIPGTYPDAPGVQHRVVAGYDPRPGMVAFARMAHLYAERTWAGVGLKRKPDGTVAEEVLVGRRAKLPGTLAGIWPGKVINPPTKSATNARPPAPAAATQSSAAQPAVTAPQVAAPAIPQQVNTPASTTTTTAGDARAKKVRSTALPSKPIPLGHGKAVQSAEAAAATTSTAVPSTPSANATATPASIPTPAQPNATATAPPRLAPLPLPQPRKPPPVDPPCVPEGTLGNRTRPGMAAWFERVAVRADVLERVTGMREARRGYVRAMEGAVREAMAREGKVFAVEFGEAGAVEGGKTGQREVDEGEEGEERGKKLPVHLRQLVLPPVPPMRKMLWARPGLGVPGKGPRRE